MSEPNLKFNWGAFLMPLQFGFATKSWMCFLTLVPMIGIIFQFLAGFKGAQWAYDNGDFQTVEEFNAVMHTLNRAGKFNLILVCTIIVLYIVCFGAIMALLASAASGIGGY